MDKDLRVTVLDPLAKFSGYFPEVNEAVRRRNKKLLDYDSARAKVRKLVEHPSQDADKLPRAEEHLAETKELYEQLNQQLIEDLPKLIDVRVPFLDPSFDAMLRCQLKFIEDA